MLIKAFIAKVEAYERKESAGGGYSAVIAIKKLEGNSYREGELVDKIQLPKFDDQGEAMQAAYEKVEAFERANGDRLSVAHFASNKYRKDYTIWKDVPNKTRVI